MVLNILEKLEKIHKRATPFFFFLLPAMQQKSVCLSPVAFEVVGHHRQAPLASDLPDGHHHGHHTNHGRVQHGESGPRQAVPVSRDLETFPTAPSVTPIAACQIQPSTAAAAASLRGRLQTGETTAREGGSFQRFPTS